VFPPTAQAGCVLLCGGGDGHGPAPPPPTQVTGAAMQPVRASKEPFFARKQQPDLQQPSDRPVPCPDLCHTVM